MYEPFLNILSDASISDGRSGSMASVDFVAVLHFKVDGVTTSWTSGSGGRFGSMASLDFVAALHFKVEEPTLSTIAHEEATVSVGS